MGFFYEKLMGKPLHEVEVDGQQQPEAGGEAPTDYTASGDGPQEGNNPSNAGGEENPGDQKNQGAQEQPEGGGEEEGEEEPTTDYTMPDAGGEEEGDQSGEDSGGDTSGGGTSDEEPEVDDIKKREEELYSDLSPQQLDIKHKELKTQYLAMYDMVNDIIDRIGDSSTSEENISIVEYVSEQLASLQKMLTDYMNDVYKTKSYIENSINYNRFLAILNGINKILEEMNKRNSAE